MRFANRTCNLELYLHISNILLVGIQDSVGHPSLLSQLENQLPVELIEALVYVYGGPRELSVICDGVFDVKCSGVPGIHSSFARDTCIYGLVILLFVDVKPLR